MLNQLREILPNQLHDLRLLNDIANVIIKEQHPSISVQTLRELNDQISLVTEKQQQRFKAIDNLMNEHFFAAKKGIVSSERIVVLSKEVRKTEAGIRTVKLFLCDVMNMLNSELHLVNRFNDRIQYFFKRSKELEKEIAVLHEKIN